MTINKLRNALCLCLLGASCTLPLPASAQTAAAPTANSIAERLQSLYPATRFGAVNTTPWPGVFEVVRDRVGAWRALMLHDMQPDDASPARECPHPVDRNIALGERLGISGTPTLVAADGRILPGAASRAQIEAWLARATASAEGPASPKSAAR